MRPWNFSAGPSAMPLEVLQTAAAEVETVEALPAVVDTGLAQPVSDNDDTTA